MIGTLFIALSFFGSALAALSDPAVMTSLRGVISRCMAQTFSTETRGSHQRSNRPRRKRPGLKGRVGAASRSTRRCQSSATGADRMRDTTHFVQIIIARMPNANVFRLANFPEAK